MSMTTGQLQQAAAAQMEQARQEANEATVRQNMPTVLAMQQEAILKLQDKLASAQNIARLQRQTIAELEAENAALRAVAVAVERLEAHEMGTFAEFGHIPNEDLSDEYMRSLLYIAYEAMRSARAAGYLPAEGVAS